MKYSRYHLKCTQKNLRYKLSKTVERNMEKTLRPLVKGPNIMRAENKRKTRK